MRLHATGTTSLVLFSGLGDVFDKLANARKSSQLEELLPKRYRPREIRR
jgi:hypothetical protein